MAAPLRPRQAGSPSGAPGRSLRPVRTPTGLGSGPALATAWPAVIDDIAYLAEQLFGGQDADDSLFEVAVAHHTQCGTSFLAGPGFRHLFVTHKDQLNADLLAFINGTSVAHGAPALTQDQCLRPRV